MLKGSVSNAELLKKLPYLGVDIEEVTKDYVRIEYNPNRPDYSTDYGLAIGLNGLLGFEVGTPVYNVHRGAVEVIVEKSVKKVRPYIVGVVAGNIKFDDESIRQIITMQEDLHNGVGRKRKKVSIGIHNLDVLEPPIVYETVSKGFKFVPLGETRTFTIKEILSKTEVGKTYGWILSGSAQYPILKDSKDQVLSFPPIINGELTRVTSKTRNLFIDITGTDPKAVSDALSVLSAGLHDAGARLGYVKIVDGNSSVRTPDMKPRRFEIDIGLTNRLLGLNLSKSKVVECLSKSRINSYQSNTKIIAEVPRYRIDIMHQVDLVEEIAIGYGLEKFKPSLPKSSQVGGPDARVVRLSVARDTLVGLGLIEVMNFSLLSRETLYERVGRKQSGLLRVDRPKAGDHEFLRDLLFPSLLENLAKNLHEEYPQRIFEIAKSFLENSNSQNGVKEEYHVAVALAHSQAGYTEAKSYLESLLSHAFGVVARTPPGDSFVLSPGRAAEIRVGRSRIGILGEVRPGILENFQIKVPVALFELNIEPLAQ